MLWWMLKGSVILLFAFAATLLLRRKPAALRHAVWTVAIASQLLIPFAPRLAPARVLAVNVPVMDATPVVTTPNTTPTSPESKTAPLPSLEPLLTAGTSLLLLRLLLGTIRVWRVARRARRVTDGTWLSTTSTLCEMLGIRRPVTLLRTNELTSPVTWGFVYPVILLPDGDWSEARRRHVLLHELAHIRRADALTQLVAQMALAVFWCNPLLWLAVKQMRAEAEHACDDYVLRDGERPSAYAKTLFELVRERQNAPLPAFATLSVGTRSELEGRVQAITDPARDSSRRRVFLTAAVATALLIVLPLSALRHDEPLPAAFACRPLFIDDKDFHETSGTLTANGRTTHYFFLRPAGDRCLEASFSLGARFADDDRDVVATPGLEALVHEGRPGLDRAVFLAEANGVLTRRYLVDGKEAAWDRDAQRWYAAVLPDVIRRSYAGAPDRARRIVERDGVDGLFDEVGAMPLVDVRARYLTELLDLRPELPRRELIARARPLLDYEPTFARFLAEILAREGSDAAVRAAVLDAASTLRDYGSREEVRRASGTRAAR